MFRANKKCKEIDDNTHCPSPKNSRESRPSLTKPKIKIPAQGKMQGAKEKICPFFKVCKIPNCTFFLPRNRTRHLSLQHNLCLLGDDCRLSHKWEAVNGGDDSDSDSSDEEACPGELANVDKRDTIRFGLKDINA